MVYDTDGYFVTFRYKRTLLWKIPLFWRNAVHYNVLRCNVFKNSVLNFKFSLFYAFRCAVKIARIVSVIAKFFYAKLDELW